MNKNFVHQVGDQPRFLLFVCLYNMCIKITGDKGNKIHKNFNSYVN
jgi:hypothetical protein